MAETRWSNPEVIPVAGDGSHEPAIAASGDILHLVWVQDKMLYHSRRVDGEWQQPVRFMSGEQPALAAGPDGKIHLVFANWFVGNSEIYYMSYDGNKWSLPQWVSRTSGVSAFPAIAVDGAGVGRVAFSDTTPGKPVIYCAERGDIAWLHAPIPNGAGSQPSIAITPAGEILLAWSDQVAAIRDGKAASGPHQVFCSIFKGGKWSLPEMISVDRSRPAVAPCIASDHDGNAQMVWQEEREGCFVVKHALRTPGGWTLPAEISESGEDSRLGHIFASPLGQYQIVWSEGMTIRHRMRGKEKDAPWGDVELACGDCPGTSELAAALSAQGELHIVWSAYDEGDRRHLRYIKRHAPVKQKVFMPAATGGE